MKMAGKRTDHEDREGSFADKLRDVKPLANRSRTVAPRVHRPSRPAPDRAEESAGFTFPDPEEPLLGVSRGMSGRQLRRLRSARIPPESRVDLHGQDAVTARRSVERSLLEAWERGLRCVLVVHGRGRHSETSPVLKTELPNWLTLPPLGPLVLAFAPARPADGGQGATYVLLRRRRS